MNELAEQRDLLSTRVDRAKTRLLQVRQPTRAVLCLDDQGRTRDQDLRGRRHVVLPSTRPTSAARAMSFRSVIRLHRVLQNGTPQSLNSPKLPTMTRVLRARDRRTLTRD